MNSIVIDCEVSQWGAWSPCPHPDEEEKSCQSYDAGVADKGDTEVVTQRHRVVLRHPKNGGAKCPGLVQSRPCPTCVRTTDTGEIGLRSPWTAADIGTSFFVTGKVILGTESSLNRNKYAPSL